MLIADENRGDLANQAPQHLGSDASKTNTAAPMMFSGNQSAHASAVQL